MEPVVEIINPTLLIISALLVEAKLLLDHCCGNCWLVFVGVASWSSWFNAPARVISSIRMKNVCNKVLLWENGGDNYRPTGEPRPNEVIYGSFFTTLLTCT